MRRPLRFFMPALLVVLACNENGSTPPTTIPPGSLGRIGPFAVPIGLLSPLSGDRREAWDALQHDLLFSLEAQHRVPAARATIERGLLGRQLLASLQAEARVLGAPTIDEASAIRRELWLDLDRPRAVSTLDAFVPVAPLAPDTAAFTLAERLHAAAEQSRTAQDFADRVATVVGASSSARIIRRPPTAEDGRVVPLGALDLQLEPLPPQLGRFVAALEAGTVSQVVGGPDGFHVFFSTGMQPPYRPSDEESDALILSTVLARRAGPRWDELKARLHAHVRVELVPNHTTLTRLVWRERE